MHWSEQERKDFVPSFHQEMKNNEKIPNNTKSVEKKYAHVAGAWTSVKRPVLGCGLISIHKTVQLGIKKLMEGPVLVCGYYYVNG